MDSESISQNCRSQLAPCRRRTCRECNNAYMRVYLRERRHSQPIAALLERARGRARSKGVAYALSATDLKLPKRCPVLGIKLMIGDRRSEASPSLDRIKPEKGYVPGNVRIVSDKANRLKGDRSREDVLGLARSGRAELRDDYRKVADYIEREELLSKVRSLADTATCCRGDWAKISAFLDSYLQRRADAWCADDPRRTSDASN